MERLARIFGRASTLKPRPISTIRVYSTRPVQPGRWDPHVTRVKRSLPKLPVRGRMTYTCIRITSRIIFSEGLL